MFQNYVEQSTKKVLHILELAVSELVQHQQNVLTPDFILLALLDQPDSEAQQIIQRLSSDPKTLVANVGSQIQLYDQDAKPVKSSQIVASKEVADLFEIALDEAHGLGDQYVSTGTLFLAMFNSRVGHVAGLLNEAGLERKQALEVLKELRGGRVIEVHTD